MTKPREVKEQVEVEEEIDDESADVSSDEEDGEELSGLGGSDYSGDELEDEDQKGFVARGEDESDDEDNLDYLELKMYDRRQAHIAKRKEVIATTAASILEDPESRVRALWVYFLSSYTGELIRSIFRSSGWRSCAICPKTRVTPSKSCWFCPSWPCTKIWPLVIASPCTTRTTRKSR